MNLDVKKITILVFVLIVMQAYIWLPSADALFIFDDKVQLTMVLKEAKVIHKSLGPHLNETQVKIQKLEDTTGIINLLKVQRDKNENLGIIITQMCYEEELKKQELIQPIHQDLVKSILSDLNPVFKNKALSTKKEIFSLPISRNTPLMFYNITAIRKLGCELENFSEVDIPTNWNDFVSLLLLLKPKDTKKPPLLLGGEAYEWIFQSMVAQQGSSLIDDNNEPNLMNPESVKTLERWQDLKIKNLIEIEKYWVSAINIFLNKKSPIVCFSNDGIAKIIESNDNQFEWAVGPLPVQKNAKVIPNGFNIYWGANMTNAQMEASKTIINLLYSESVQLDIFRAGSWPVKKEIVEELMTYQSKKDEVYQIAAEQLKYLVEPKYSPKQTALIKALQTAIKSALYDGTSPQEALQTAQDDIQNKQ